MAARFALHRATNRKILLLAIYGVLGLVLCWSAQAAVLNWTGSIDAEWAKTGNWWPTQLPTLADDAIFPSSIPGTGTITLPTDATVNNLTFNNSYTLQSGTLTFGASQQITVGSGYTVEISSALVSNQAYLKKAGDGILILSGDNSGSSTTTNMDVNAGVVRVTNNNAVPGGYFHVTNASAVVELFGGVTIPSGKRIYLSGAATTDNPSLRSVSGNNIWNGTLTLHNEDGDHVVGVDAGSTLRINGPVNQSGGPDNLVKVGAGTLILAGTGSYTGFTRVKAGTLQLENSLALQKSTLEMNSAYTGTIQFGTPSEFTLGGLTGSANLDMQTKTLKIGDNNTDTAYSGVLSNGSLTKVGTGTLTLTTDSTYTGPTTVSGGRLTLNKSAGDREGSTIQSTSITVNAGAELRLASTCQFGWKSPSVGTTFTLDGGSLTTADNTHNYIPTLIMKNGATMSLGAGGYPYQGAYWQIFDLRSITSLASTTVNTITSAGGYIGSRAPVTISVGNGTADPDLRIGATFGDGPYYGATSITKTGDGTLELTAPNVYTGATNVNAGVLRITHGQALGSTAAGTTVLSSGQLQLSGNITVSGEALTLNQSGGTATATLLRNTSGNNTWAGPITVALASKVEVDSGTTLTISGDISGARFDKTGAGTLILSGDNSGTTDYMDVANGVVILRSNNSPIGTYFNIWAPGAVHFENNITTLGGKILYLSNAGSETNPQVRSLSGHNTWGGNVVLHYSVDDSDASRSKYIGVDAGSTLTILGTVSESTAGVTGSRNLVKVGAGTLELKGAGTYTGTTRIMAGTLLANNTSGSATGTGLVDVQGGMLGGNGTIGGAVQVQSGGTLSAGNSPGHLTIQGSYTQAGKMLVELAGYTQGGTQAVPGQWTANGYDWVSVGGSAVLDGYVDIALLAGFQPQPGDAFYVLTATGGITDQGITLTWTQPLLPAQYWTYGIVPWEGQGGGEALVLSFGVPEPTSLSLMSLGVLFVGGAGIWASRRRRNR